MKQKLLFLLAALAFLLPARLSAFNYKYEGVTLRYEVIDEEAKTCMVSGFKDFSGDLVIPDVANDGTTDYSVTEIGKEAFYDCSGLTSVVIPESVTSIGEQAFSGCSGLTKAEFTSIKSLCDINFGNASANPLSNAKHLYIDGIEMTEVVIPETVNSIKYTFYGCTYLKSVIIPNSVKEIGEAAFYGCSGLTSVEIPNSVASIGNEAFYFCSGLTSVEIPNSVASIGNKAFYYCSGLTSVVIGNSVETIGNEAFYHCKGLTSVVIGNSVQTIGAFAFCGCSGLTSVVNGNSVKTIGSSAFKGCSRLTSVVIPESVQTIGSSAFDGCRSLTSVVIGNSVETIGGSAFSDCRGLTSVLIPNSVTEIGSFIFNGCTSLSYVVIGSSVKTIASGAFSGCDNLTCLVIGCSVTSIGNNAFPECKKLVKIAIPIHPKGYWPDGTFDFVNRSATSISYDAQGAIIEDGCVYGPNKSTIYFAPSNLEGEFILSEFVETIGYSAFRGCSGLTSVVIGNSVQTIDHSAFKGCSGLTSVVIGNSVETIGDSAFQGCSGLTSVVIPNSVKTISNDAFYSCKLDTIIMGHGIETIGSSAFYQCPASSIYITAQTPPEIQSSTFGNYKGTLYLQGQAAVNAYDDDKYWGNFNNELMTVPTTLEIEGLTSISGNAGDTFQLKAKMTPEDVTLPYILWRSTNPKIATVDNNGLMELQEYSAEDLTRAEGDEDNDGTCKIIAESLYFDGPIAEITVNHTGVAAASIALDESNLDLKVGQSAKLTATVKNVEDETVTWTSSNDAVATVDAEGNVTAVAVGEADITATCGNVSASCKVTVTPILVESLTIDPTAWSGVEGSEFTIKATVLPENAENKALTFESSDSSVATVDAEGNVKVLKEGSCVITVATTDGSNLTAECVITSLSGVDAIFADPDATVDVFDMNGVMLKKGCSREELKQLKPAVYILRSGDTVVKTIVK